MTRSTILAEIWAVRLALIGLVFACIPHPVGAQDLVQAMAQCSRADGDDSIAGCNSLIATGRGSAAALAVTYYNRGTSYARKGLLDQAIADFTQAIALNPRYFHAFSNRGAAYCDKGLFDLAIADDTKAIELAPNNSRPYSNRGMCFATQGQRNLAVADLRAALAIDPSDMQALDGLKVLGATP